MNSACGWPVRWSKVFRAGCTISGRRSGPSRRKQFDELAGRFISRVKSDPGYHARIESWKRQFLGTPVVAEYFETLWVHFRHWIQKDAMDSGSEMKHRLSRTFRRFGRWILENPAMTESINDQMIQITQAMSEEIRSTVAQHIVYTVRNWDSRSMVRELGTVDRQGSPVHPDQRNISRRSDRAVTPCCRRGDSDVKTFFRR